MKYYKVLGDEAVRLSSFVRLAELVILSMNWIVGLFLFQFTCGGLVSADDLLFKQLAEPKMGGLLKSTGVFSMELYRVACMLIDIYFFSGKMLFDLKFR